FRNDIGITSVYNPVETCAPKQRECHEQRNGNGPQGDHEINGILFETAVEFTASLAVPEARRATAEVRRGQAVFDDLSCAACHTPSHDIVVSGEQTTIWPYTDLLLHDMGPLLADGIPQGDATGGEWRTPPLWSLGLQQQLNPETGFLHDGRAATIQEAVLWHGGEAATAAARFKALSKAEQDALTAFVLAL
ncbi:MAG: di-heme oxidoredictase family protein, partial [Pseudomonadota bacterium]